VTRRIGVAATAPFGADVLERLAARHDVAFVLTRPDARAGRGRKTAPPPAKQVAERLGLRGVTIFHVPEEPTLTPMPTAAPGAATAPLPTPVAAAAAAGPSPTATSTPPAAPTPTPAPVGSRLGLGQHVSLDEARSRVPYGVLAPTLPELGAPDAVYLQQAAPPGGQVSLVYASRPGLPRADASGVGLLLSQFRGDLAPEFLGKGLGPRTRIEQVSVNGQPAYWIEGEAHLFMYRVAGGDIRDEQVRLAGNVLLWEQGDLTLRLESALPREQALRIAESVR